MLRLTSKNIQGLEAYSPSQRVHLIHLAGKMMPFGRRAIANIIKVLLLIAVFWSILYVPGVALKLLAILAAGLLYPLALFPVTLNLALPYLDEAKLQYEAEREAANEALSDNEKSEQLRQQEDVVDQQDESEQGDER